MGKRRANWFSAVVICAGFVFVIGPGCAEGGGPGFGEVPVEDDEWGGGGGGGTSGSSGSTSSSSSSSTTSSSSGGNGGSEICNGKDDDGNGFIDDNATDAGVPCNTGGIGVCGVGEAVCKDGSLQCVEKNGPSVEVCDNLDNDCDGEVDNGNPGGGDACTTGLLGACGAGLIGCINGMFQCVPQIMPEPEVCGDNLDNDCDGAPDDGCPGAPCSHSPCESGAPLAKDCSPCVTVICNMDSFCCSTQWDVTCQVKGFDLCGC